MSDKNPSDLQIVQQPNVDKDYFNFKATGLKIDQTYAIKFQWVYDDGTVSEWSPGKFINTSTESVPAAPSAAVPSTSVGNIPVTLSAFPSNAKRVDIYVIGGTYGAGKVVDYFLAAGTKTISISEPGVYQVSLIAVTPSGINGTPSSTFTITVSANTVDTTVIPGAPSAVIVSGFNEPSDPLNRTGYANISWTAGSGAKGYSVGLWTGVPGSSDPVRQIDTNSTSLKVEGLFVGSSYYIRVKAFNEFNNLSAWVQPASNYPVTIPGTALVPGAVTISGTAAPKSIVVAWGDPADNAALVTNGGYYEVKLYTNSAGTGSPLETRKAWSNQASFSGLTTGTQYWVTVQPYTAGNTPVAGTISSIYGPLVPTAIDNPDLKGDFILASNQLQVGGTSGANDIHLSAYTKTVGSISTAGRIYIGGPETSTSVAVGLYNDSGTPFYADNLGRFSLGDKLTWSGNLSTPVLNVKGTIDVTGASTFSSYVLAGATNSAFIGIGYQVPYRLSNVLESGANGLTGIVLNSSGSIANSDWIKSDGTFRLANGALKFSGGVLEATGTITATSLSANASIDSPLITGGTYRTSETVGNGSTAGIKIDTSGIYGYTASSATPNFSVSNTGILSALAGKIGDWHINSTTIRSSSSASATPRIELDPLTPQIVLAGTAGSITMSPQNGIVGPNVTIAGNTGPGFSFSPNGNAVIRGTIYADGGIFSGTVQRSSGSNSIILDGTSFRASGSDGIVTIGYDGNVSLQSTINSFGATEGSTITLTGTSISGIEGEPANVTSTTIGPGSMSLYQGPVFGSAAFSFYQYVYNNQLNYYATGLSEITWRNYYTNPSSPTYNYSSSRVSTATSGDAFRPLGITPFGGQYMGQRLFSGTATSNTAINNDINNRLIANLSLNGDFYFSTA
jgi:hypothetical protein